jgi:MFS family permease
MGLIGTGNFVGYMLSVVLAGIVARAIGARWTIAAGLLLVGTSMVLVSRAMGFMEILTLYVITGLGSGLANVPMMGLVSHWFSRSKRGRAAGTMLMGNGFAIVFAGLLIPFVHASLGAEGWRTNWRILGTLSVCIAAVAGYFLRNRPQGAAQRPPEATGGAAADAGSTATAEKSAQRWVMVHLGCIYALFGATYAVYATFIVTTMVNERGFGEGSAGRFWAAVGALSIVSGPLFGWLSDRLGRKLGMQVVYTLFTISYALVAADLPNPFLYLSIGIFGLAVWSIPTIMTAAVGDYVAPDRAVRAFGFVTLFFGAGQIAGPAMAGAMADLTGNFNMAFGCAAVLTAGAVVLTQFLKPPADA